MSCIFYWIMGCIIARPHVADLTRRCRSPGMSLADELLADLEDVDAEEEAQWVCRRPFYTRHIFVHQRFCVDLHDTQIDFCFAGGRGRCWGRQ